MPGIPSPCRLQNEVYAQVARSRPADEAAHARRDGVGEDEGAAHCSFHADAAGGYEAAASAVDLPLLRVRTDRRDGDEDEGAAHCSFHSDAAASAVVLPLLRASTV